MQRGLLVLIIFVILIGGAVVFPPTTLTFLSIAWFLAIVACGVIVIIYGVALVLSWWFTNAIISENLRYEPIDSDNFLEVLLEEGLNTELSVKVGQNRLSRTEINQIDSIVKRRLKLELRHNLHRITYNTLKRWLALFATLNVIFLLVVVILFGSVAK